MGDRTYINNDWLFSEKFSSEMVAVDFNEDGMEQVRLPHTCKETPFNYFDEHIYQMESLYRKTITVPEEWEGSHVLLTFEGVGHESEVFLNGEPVGEHHCGYTAFTIDLSDKLNYGQENVLAVRVDSRENLNVPPFGFVIDYMTYGGIYRDVYLQVKNKNYITDAFLSSDIKWDKGNEVYLVSEIKVKKAEENISLRQHIHKKGEENGWKLLGECQFLPGKAKTELKFPVEKVQLWDTENPILYEVKTQLLKGMTVLDENVTTIGFREARFRKDGFYLNNKKLKIRGLNRHQSYPYVGYAMPKSMQEMDAEVLKNELGLNAVRTSHYPQSHDFLNRCDELGLLVFTEMPGWQHIGNEEWKLQAIQNVKDMVVQYRNHAAIILWGVRINESKDDDEFYIRTNEAARELDNTRQTAGVRCYKKGSFLEDVYTYNDFSHTGDNKGCEPKKNVTSDCGKPYLVSEYNGHMFPTKTFDGEEHRSEHAIRHANVLNEVAGYEDIAGGFGWCMTDYNTHKDFGSGDRICYHGVMDMFRNPKMAAEIYACQQEITPVLSISSTMDIGEHPGCNRGDTWIFTNADSVKMYKNDRFIKEYKRSDSPYKNLAHGPILIDDYVGDAIEKNESFKPAQARDVKKLLNLVSRYGLYRLPKKAMLDAAKLMVVYGMKMTQAVELYNKYIGDWGGASTVYRFEAIKDGKVIKSLTKAPMTKLRVAAQASHTELTEGRTYDVAAVRIHAEDENGSLLPFFQEPVVLHTEGPVQLIGGDVISLKGGMGGTYLKTTGETGKAALIIKSAQAEAVRIEFTVKKENE